METLKNLVAKHWKKILGGGIAVAGAFVPALAPLIPLGTLILGSDFQVGSSIGTPVGSAAKQLAEAHGALTQEQIAELARAAQAVKQGLEP